MKYQFQYVDEDIEKKMKLLTFSDLKVGDLFTDVRKGYGYLCIKCMQHQTALGTKINAIRLDDGGLCLLGEDQRVDLYNGVITLNTNDFVSEIEEN